MSEIQPPVQLTAHPLSHLWGLLSRRASGIRLESGQLLFEFHRSQIAIPIGEITALRLERGILFSRLEVHTVSNNYRIGGLSSRSLGTFVTRIQRMALTVLQHSSEWRRLMRSVERYQSGVHYFSTHEWQALAALLPLQQRLGDLAIDEAFIAREQDNSVAQLALKLTTKDVSELARDHFNRQVIPRLLVTNAAFFDQIEKQPLSQPQREACVTNEDHTLVVAGAGTGKTSTIIGKAGYLLHSGLAQPDNILMLAFGNKAAGEMEERIATRLPAAASKLKATTFHAFGNRIVAETQGTKMALTRFAEQDNELHQFIESVLEQQIARSADYSAELIKYFVCYSTPGRCEYDFETIEEYHEFLESCRLITLKGEFVKSVGELRVANYLHLYSVPYAYEAAYIHKTATVDRRQYKPDFYLPDSQLYIEYLGLDRQQRTAPFVNQDAYLEGVAWKRELHRQQGTHLAELYSYQLWEGILEEALLEILNNAKIPHQLRNIDLLLDELKASSMSPWQGFIDLMLRFLSLFKEGQFTFESLNEPARGVDLGRTRAFLSLFKPVFEAYEKQMLEQGELDFSDMIANATQALQEGRFQHRYDYVLVDEFQDLSGGRGKLLRALLASRTNMRLFAVGDDWQSIYRFNGSDLRFFTQFDQQFKPSRMLPLDKSYRFNNRIHELSAAFVMCNPAQLKKQIITHTQVEHPAVQLLDIQEMMEYTPESASKRERKAGSYALLVRRALKRCSDRQMRLNKGGQAPVMLIGRYRKENMSIMSAIDLQFLAQEFPLLDIHYQTAHASKGLEADYVIILGLDEGGFPSARENDELIDLLLPERESYLFAEERRLFYVAMTRARHYVFMIFDGQNASGFAVEIAKMGKQYVTKKDDLTLGLWGCPSCESGWLKTKTNNYNKKFYVCSHEPACDHITNACKQCGAPLLNFAGLLRVCANNACREIEIGCRRCGIGTMRQRKNKDGGSFYGCSRFRREAADCCYENITSEEYELRMSQATVMATSSSGSKIAPGVENAVYFNPLFRK
ncbi:UvrD-helicase domain-containing protein [Aeromonas rivipollensis]|uniref:UvrD-helicase domain-containing protein n=1 Tax=Aeromonas rivipollensis TaxID=948519 RepID=UPI001F34897D|nr:UvrD-helicase domain-containing protein [Aeromonas rivipollensis]MCE9943724.1 UvrD-helicase domain-containing protein [Aeromonas rivipollensis]